VPEPGGLEMVDHVARQSDDLRPAASYSPDAGSSEAKGRAPDAIDAMRRYRANERARIAALGASGSFGQASKTSCNRGSTCGAYLGLDTL